jgi:hypothetical protein
MTERTLADAYLRDILRAYRMYKDLGERAIAQVASDADLHRQIDPDSNSIAIMVKHIAGNLRSRFRDFLTTDGEKPDRNRDAEFEMKGAVSREELLRWWNDGWEIVLRTAWSLETCPICQATAGQRFVLCARPPTSLLRTRPPWSPLKGREWYSAP